MTLLLLGIYFLRDFIVIIANIHFFVIIVAQFVFQIYQNDILFLIFTFFVSFKSASLQHVLIHFLFTAFHIFCRGYFLLIPSFHSLRFLQLYVLQLAVTFFSSLQALFALQFVITFILFSPYSPFLQSHIIGIDIYAILLTFSAQSSQEESILIVIYFLLLQCFSFR